MKNKKEKSDTQSVNEENVTGISDIHDSDATPLVTQDVSAQNEEEDEVASLDSLLYDDMDETSERESPEELHKYEDFLSDYKAFISKSTHKDVNATSHKPSGKTIRRNSIYDVSIEDTAKTKKANKKSNTEESSQSNEWDDEITLVPETYEAPDENDNIFRDTPMPEEDFEEDVFSIGKELYPDENDEIQFSIKFDESNTTDREAEKAPSEYKYDPEHPRIIDGIFDFIELFVLTLVCVMILTTFVFKHSIVEGRSMQNTLNDGDSLIISDLFYTPERYDIVVFEDYSTSLKKAVVKRVIGLPGEKVEVKINEDKIYEVYINDELLEEGYALNVPDSSPPPTGVWHIEEGEIFVMGDNRYNSTDSRDGGVGPVDIECILGKVIIRIYPFDQFGKVD